MTATNYSAENNSLMEYTDDGDSESEVLGPIQESQHAGLENANVESDEELTPSHGIRIQADHDSQRARG